MNIYDTKTIICAICKKVIGEIDYDAQVIYPKCGQCSNPLPEVRDHIIWKKQVLKQRLEII